MIKNEARRSERAGHIGRDNPVLFARDFARSASRRLQSSSFDRNFGQRRHERRICHGRSLTPR